MNIGQRPTTPNTFNDGVYMDASDMVLKNTMLRNMMNMRLVNLEGTSFCVSNFNGTEEKFQLSDGFLPLAARDYNEVLYIVSYNPVTLDVEVGSFPSPDYASPSSGNDNVYRPFNNLNNGPLRTSQFSISAKPVITDIEIQPDYDSSVNVMFTMANHLPRIVNSKFKVESDLTGNRTYSALTSRAGTVNSNDYTSSTIEKETRQILSTDKVLEIAFVSIGEGGKVKPGNYHYIFCYMTEDFNRTDVVGQSSTCQVAFGSTVNDVHGGSEQQETTKKVTLKLFNVDTDFKYLKVFALYSAGLETTFQQYLEFTDPVVITGEVMSFSHSGFEQLAEVSSDVVNTEFSTIETAVSLIQIDNRLIYGGIVERNYDFEPFRTASAALRPTLAIRAIPNTTLPGYADPQNVYNSLGYFGQESYPFGIVYVMPGNRTSPVFPIKGRLFDTAASEATPVDQVNGVVTFPQSYYKKPVESGLAQAKYLKFDVSSIPQGIRDQSVGFFFVRGERIPWLLTQAMLCPTVRVSNVEYVTGGDGTDYYYDRYDTDLEQDAYGFAPAPDGMVESFRLDEVGTSVDPQYVVDELFQIDKGYMPIGVLDMRALYGPVHVDNFALDRWALLSGEGIVDEPAMITNLLRDTVYVQQIGMINSRVKGSITPLLQNWQTGEFPHDKGIGLHFDMESIGSLSSNGFKAVSNITYISGETLATGSEFVSRIAQRFKWYSNGGSDLGFDVYQKYNSYFGLKMQDTLVDNTKSAAHPYHGNLRYNVDPGLISFLNSPHTIGLSYQNLNDLIPVAFLANIYSSASRPTASQLYPSVDNIIYKQITARTTWARAASQSNIIDVLGGDCYISKVSRRLNQSGFRNPSLTEGAFPRANINAGITMSWWQESKYNLYLRQEIQYDTVETEKRGFFPYQTRGDVIAYRKHRYPESGSFTKGYSESLPPRSSFSLPVGTPFIQSDFFTRVMASEPHVPNSFRNGYRNFSGLNFKDYDSSLGRILKVANHKNNLAVIFEHGIGIGPVNQRVQTGLDAAGAIFVEPKEFLPPRLTYSKGVGTQHFYSIVQSPEAMYGVDAQKKCIWQLADQFKIISNDGFSSFLQANPPINPRSGFDPETQEVTFTTDNWTLVYKQDKGQFYFMSFKPSFYSRLAKKMLSFTDKFNVHGAETYKIYGNEYESYLEFVVNNDLSITKTFDWIEIISNQVRPSRVEFFTYSGVPIKASTIVPAGCHQYVKALAGIDPITLEETIELRDKSYLVQVPPISIYNPTGTDDTWELDSRLRNKYMIVRITYNTQSALQLISVLTNYRYSYS